MGRTTDLRRIVLYTIAVIMASFGMTSIASAQTLITNTGTGSFNSASSNTSSTCALKNSNDVSVSNQTSQDTTTGSATDANNQGLPWTGWAALDPATAQAADTSYNAWRSEVTDWIAARASGAGWMSTGSNPTWTPSTSDWASFDPLLWQANGQTFAHWLNATESYLNSNSASWILSWPASATGDTSGNSAISGDATSNNNADFSITINDASTPATTGCTSNAATGGMGGGPGTGTGSTTTVAGGVQGLANSSRSSSTPSSNNNAGVGQGGSQYATYAQSPTYSPATEGEAVSPSQGGIATSTSSESGSSTPGSGPSSTGANTTISNTGPCSTNIASTSDTQATTVSNINTVNVTNNTTQTTTSGASTVSGNGSVSSSGSGNAGATNGTGIATGISD